MKHIYAVRRSDGIIKVGITQNPVGRFENLRIEVKQKIVVVYITEPRSDARQIEIYANKILSQKQHRGEWFSVTEAEAINAIQTAIRISEGEIENITVGMKYVRRTIPPQRSNGRKGFERVQISLHPDLGKSLRKYAKEENRPLSKAIEWLVKCELERLGYLTPLLRPMLADLSDEMENEVRV